jgi:hypothetical protein
MLQIERHGQIHFPGGQHQSDEKTDEFLLDQIFGGEEEDAADGDQSERVADPLQPDMVKQGKAWG